jgi:membrane protease YdiL (CAAX protease family)
MQTIILLLIFLFLPIFYYRVINEKNWNQIRKELIPKFKGFKKEFVGTTKLFFLLFMGAIIIKFLIILIDIFLQTKVMDMENVAGFVETGMTINPITFIIMMIIIVFLEEYFFRAFLVKRIGIIFSTLIFTFFHLGYESITQTIGVLLLGLLLAYWFKKHDSLIQNYFGHLAYNCIAILLYLI